MKALVTGATGFIGSHLVDELVKRGFRVTCLVRKTSSLQWIEGLDINLFYGDCEFEDSLAGLDGAFDYVFHLAGLTKARREEDFFRSNVRGTENMVRTVTRNRGLKRFLYLSSLAASGPSRNGSAPNEGCEPRPVSGYGRSKLEAERAVLQYRDAIPVTVIRPPAVYGPRDRDLHLFFRLIQRGFFPYWGKCYYSLLYVDDLVTGSIMAAEADEAVGKVYFLSDGDVYSNDDIAREIAGALGRRAVRIPLSRTLMKLVVGIGERMSRSTSIMNTDKLKELGHSTWTCDSSKAARELRFAPTVTMKEGIKWTADWYRIHQWL